MERRQQRVLAFATLLPAIALGVHALLAPSLAHACDACDCEYANGCYEVGSCITGGCSSDQPYQTCITSDCTSYWTACSSECE